MRQRLAITGGLGFIGSALVRRALSAGDTAVLVIDKMTYAANPAAVAAVSNTPNYQLAQIDIGDSPNVAAALAAFQPTAIINLAAETHVDRSIDGPDAFIETNIVGTYRLLQTARAYFAGLSGAAREGFRFLHVSTDEVYGELTPTCPPFSEETAYHPNSPYSASKAASDHLARAWAHTFGLPVLITNCSNNYGPWQFPEKLIPLMISKLLAGEQLPVYGKGENVRDWLFVDDHARALLAVLERGQLGETYCIGGGAERRNIDVVRALCALMDARFPARAPHDRLIQFVTDRPGHDLRYAIDSGKITSTLGWRPSVTFETGLEQTLDWYLAHQAWWRDLAAARYGGERLGKAG